MAKQALEKIRGGVGLWAHAHEIVAPSASGEIAALAESLGYAAYWLPEAGGREALVSSSLLLAATSELVVGTAIASIWARDAMASMNGARTLHDASGGRFVLGLGVSHQPLVEHLRGHRYERPLAAMSDYLDAMASVPALGMLERDDEPPVLIAALGPGMLRLAGAKCDGALPYLVSPAHTATARELLGPDAFLAVEQAVAPTVDDEEFESMAAGHLKVYLGLPNYANNLRRLGFDDEDLGEGGSRRLKEALVVHGDDEQVWARIDAHFAAGADHVSIQVLGRDLRTAPLDAWRRFSPSRAGR